jgi:hypothetical protein
MNDLLYVLGTIAFFALMIAYVRGCDRLGQLASADSRGGGSPEGDDESR